MSRKLIQYINKYFYVTEEELTSPLNFQRKKNKEVQNPATTADRTKVKTIEKKHLIGRQMNPANKWFHLYNLKSFPFRTLNL